jgi:S1-C subfamily serine protease
MIVAIEGSSPADRADLLAGDVLLSAAGEPVDDTESLLGVLARAGDVVRLRVMRGGAVSEIDVDLRAKGPGRAA